MFQNLTLKVYSQSMSTEHDYTNYVIHDTPRVINNLHIYLYRTIVSHKKKCLVKSSNKFSCFCRVCLSFLKLCAHVLPITFVNIQLLYCVLKGTGTNQCTWYSINERR